MTFIVVEGPEGAGKSTLTRWLTAQLLAEGRRVLTVRQPGGTPIAEAARKLALKSKHAITPAAELFLFLAARADLVDRVVRPALDDGQVVLADRYDLSTLAYQVAGRGLPRGEVEAALRLATVGRERQRRARKEQDRIEVQEDAFHERVRESYRTAAGPGIVHIDARQSKQAVQDAAWREVQAVTAPSLRGVT